MTDLRRLYDRLYKRALARFPDLPPSLPLYVDPAAHTSARSFGVFRWANSGSGGPSGHRGNPESISLAPELKRSPGRAEGVCAHEIGHLVHCVYGRPALQRIAGDLDEAWGGKLPRSNERLADCLGELVCGSVIGYDLGTVQTTDPEEIVYQLRPARLG